MCWHIANKVGRAVLATPAALAFLPEKGTQMNATATARARQRRPRPKPERRIRLCVRPDGQSAGVVRITVGQDEADYLLTEIPADYGRGFQVERVGLDCAEAAYHVNIDGDNRTCECAGFLRWNRCKHSDGLAALVAAGRL
jgi:hypothetical protein